VLSRLVLRLVSTATRAFAPGKRAFAVTTILGWLAIVLPPFVMLSPWLAHRDTYGFHDWDVMESHRYLVVSALRDYHELPWWNPYACGGFPAWGYIEGGTILVSPFLPVYLLTDLRSAIRVEVLVMTLLGSLGCWLLAGRFTRHPAARAVVPAIFAYDGRFGLQAAAGHAWHLAYAFVPFTLFFFDRAMKSGVLSRDTALLGATFAALVYAGGIYPLPHAVMLVGLFAALLALAEHSGKPVGVLAAGGLIGGLLAAPKLVPMLATFARAPRLVASTESLSPEALLIALTSRTQGFFDRPADVSPYGWHEWGIYIGVPFAMGLAIAFVLSKGTREGALKIVGAVFVVLGFGAFASWAPWTVLHAHAPFFRSQHVPSRFLYPALLCLAVVLASWLGERLERARGHRAWVGPLAGVLVLAAALDVSSVARQPMSDAMVLRAPEPIHPADVFHFETGSALRYDPPDWATPMYLPMRANTGVIECYGTPPFGEVGARAVTDPRFEGEATILGRGAARVSQWSPNTAAIAVVGAGEGATLSYNMNFDEGWRATVVRDGTANRVAVREVEGRVAVDLPRGDSTVRLSYSPPGIATGVALGLLGLGLALALPRLGRVVAAWRRQMRDDAEALEDDAVDHADLEHEGAPEGDT